MTHGNFLHSMLQFKSTTQWMAKFRSLALDEDALQAMGDNPSRNTVRLFLFYIVDGDCSRTRNRRAM